MGKFDLARGEGERAAAAAEEVVGGRRCIAGARSPYASAGCPKSWSPMPSKCAMRSSRLRVGLMSADFKRHPVGILLAPALAMCKRYCKYLHLTLIPLNPFLPPEASNSSSGSGGGSNAGKKKKSIVTSLIYIYSTINYTLPFIFSDALLI